MFCHMVDGDGCIAETWKKGAKWTVSYPCDEMKLTHHHDLLIVLECAEMMTVSYFSERRRRGLPFTATMLFQNLR